MTNVLQFRPEEAPPCTWCNRETVFDHRAADGVRSMSARRCMPGATTAAAGSRRRQMHRDHGLLHTFPRAALTMTLCVQTYQQEAVTDAYVCRLLPLTCLAPDTVEAILDGRQTRGLRLAEILGNGPFVWEEQRSVLGFSWGPTGAARD
jgi:hypothetical protein